MPTVMRVDGVRVLIYPNDHRPAHVHVIGAGHEAVFRLNCPRGPLELRENHGFGRAELSRIDQALTDVLDALCASWREWHDDHR